MKKAVFKPDISQERDNDKNHFLQKERGTNDELEILKEIVSNTAAVRTQILARLREAKARLQKKQGF